MKQIPIGEPEDMVPPILKEKNVQYIAPSEKKDTKDEKSSS